MKRYILYILVLVLIQGACTQDLDLIPKDRISDATYWKKADDFKKAATDLYSGLGGHDAFDENSDIAFGESTNSISTGSYFPNESDNTWDDAYKAIRACNIIIEKGEENPEIEGAGSYVAEARWFRAFNYHKLVKRFGDVPLITKSLDVTDEELFASRSPRTDVVKFILDDLDKAATALLKESDLTGSDQGRISQGAAYALKARVALFEGTWAKYHNGGDSNNFLSLAISASEMVINSGEYSLFEYTPAPEWSYRYKFILQGNDNPGQIVARRYDTDLGGHAFGFWIRGAGTSNSPTRNLVDMYLCTDGLPIGKSNLFMGRDKMDSEFENRDPRLMNTVVTPGARVISDGEYDFEVNTSNILKDPIPQKYPAPLSQQAGYKCFKYCGEFGPHWVWGKLMNFYHVIRYAEVLLIYAEATYEKDGSISDADLDKSINVLRQHVNMPDLTNAFVTANGLDMLTELRRERTIELAFEGFRREDLLRWKEAENVLPNDIKGVKWVGTEFETHFPDIIVGEHIKVDNEGFIIVESSSIRNFQSKHYLFPIPLKQIQLNSNLTQNPGWE